MDMDWKIAAAAIIGLSVVASAVIFSGNDMLSGFFSLPQSRGKEVSISADLDLNEFNLDLAGTSTAEMDFRNGSASVQVGKEKFDPIGNSLFLTLDDFVGRVSYYNGISFNGNARRVDFGGYLRTREKYPILIGSQSFDRIEISNVTLNSFTHTASGIVDVGYGKTKTTVRLNRDGLTIGGFSGRIEFANGRMYIEGLAEKVVAANKINVG